MHALALQFCQLQDKEPGYFFHMLVGATFPEFEPDAPMSMDVMMELMEKFLKTYGKKGGAK